MRRTKAEAEETRQRILCAAEEVFYRKGVFETTLEDVARLLWDCGPPDPFQHPPEASAMPIAAFGGTAPLDRCRAMLALLGSGARPLWNRDRARLGYVLDYADLHFGSFRPFLIFNVADACITIGVLIILARSLFMREKPAATQSAPREDPSDNGADQPAETH